MTKTLSERIGARAGAGSAEDAVRAVNLIQAARELDPQIREVLRSK